MPPQHANLQSIHKELESHNAFFDDLVDMIPAKVYVSGNFNADFNMDADAFNPKFQKGQNQDTKQARWAKSKLAKAAATAEARFDPNHALSTREEKIRLEQEQAMQDDDDDSEDDDVNISFQMEDGDDDDDDEGDHDQEKENGEQEQKQKEEKKKEGHKSKSKNSKSKSKSKKEEVQKESTRSEQEKPQVKLNENQSRIEQLRAKLRSKLEERSRHQPANGKGMPDALVSKRAARRAEKKKRQELAKKKKLASSTVTGGLAKNGLPQKVKLVEKDMGGTKLNNPELDQKKKQTVMDDLMGIDFGSIAGLKNDVTSTSNYSTVNKSLKNMGKKKSLERLLAEAEAKKERLRQLKESDNVEDKTKAQNIIWGDTLKAANGEKSRESDTTHLKKAIKRKARKKAKSQEAWKSRMEQTKEKMDERQKIRNHNVKQRALGGAAGANLSKKRIKDDVDDSNGGKDGEGGGGKDKKRPRLGPHSGKGRAGFEGKKQDFINKGGGKKRMKSQ